jgi:uncharacterized protein YeaO (DUF488 family)
MDIRIKRAYEAPSEKDGTRVLVDRLWPRGLSKDKAKIDVWLKDIAPSQELRAWFNHDPARWSEFQKRYDHELEQNNIAVDELRRYVHTGTVTLVYGTKDEQHNNAVVLQSYLG